MSTASGTSFNQARDQIITTAFNLLNVYSEGEAITSDDIRYASSLLNMMVASWQTQNHLWVKSEAVLFVQNGQAKYLLGATGAHATEDYISATLNADAAQSATTLTLASTSGMSVNDNIGIQLDTGYLQWTTISSITNSTTLVIATGLTSAASSGNVVYTYTSKINRPLGILTVRRTDSSSQEIPLFKYAYDEYFELPNKSSPGLPNAYMFNPKTGNAALYLWPTPNDVTNLVKFGYMRPLFDFQNATDTPDFPQEWLLVITYQLAVLLAPRYGKRNLIQGLKQDADMMLQNALEFDNEDASIYFQPRQY